MFFACWFRGESFLSASLVIPNGRIRLIQLALGVLVLVSQYKNIYLDVVSAGRPNI